MTPSPAEALRQLGIAPTPPTRACDSVIQVDIPGATVIVFAGTQNPNCLCLDGWMPGCPQHPDSPIGEKVGGEVG